MELRLDSVRHEADYDGTEHLDLTYHATHHGMTEEANVRVTMELPDSDGDRVITAEVDGSRHRELRDELTLERKAEEVASEHGEAFGTVEV